MSAADYLLLPVVALLYGGSFAFWPVYRFLRRGKKRLRSLAVAFVVHVALVLGWTVEEVRSALRDGDWLHGLVIYIGINILFLFVYLLLLLLGRARQAENASKAGA